MHSRDLIKLLESRGWKLVRIKGSHHQFKHENNPHLITVPHPDKDIPTGTLRSILKIAGLK